MLGVVFGDKCSLAFHVIKVCHLSRSRLKGRHAVLERNISIRRERLIRFFHV